MSDNQLKPEESWLKAEKMLDRHFRKKRIIVWTLTIFITGLIVTGSFLTYQYVSNNSSPDNGIVEKNRVEELAPGKIEKHTSVSEKNLQSNNSIQQKNRITDPVIGNAPTAENKVLHTTANNSSKKIGSNKKTGGNRNDVGSSNNAKTGNGSAYIASAAFVAKTEILQNENKNPASAISNHSEQSSSTNSDESINGEGIHEIKKSNASKDTPDGFTYLELIPVHEIPIAQAGNTIVTTRNESHPPVTPKQKFNLAVAFYGAANYVTKSLDSKEYSAYVDRRSSEEEGRIAGSFGVSFSHEIKNISIGLGIEYSTWGEKNLYLPYSNIKTTVENGDYQSFYRSDSNTVFNFGIISYQPFQVLDSQFISQVDTVIVSSPDPSVSSADNITSFSFIELPFEFSYRFARGKIGVGATAGISPAWMIGKNGYYLKRDLSGVESIPEIASFNKFIINGKFSIDLYFEMNSRFNLLLKPQVKTNLNSLFEDDYDVDQRYLSTGLVFGLQYSIW